jgi:uncharacterized protein DUF1566
MKKCPQCNHVYSDDSFVFCIDDGSTLFTVSETEPTNKKSNAVYFVVLVLAVLLTGSLVAFFYGRTSENLNKEGNIQTPANKSAESDQGKNINADIKTSQNQVRFSLSSCGSIQDSSTKLEWFVGPDKNMTWNETRQWTINLNECGGGWRMPAAEEIKALYNPSKTAGTGYYTNGKYFPAHIDPIFNGIGGGSWVWTNRSFGSEAQSFNLNQGKTVIYSTTNTIYATRAFAIRSMKN